MATFLKLCQDVARESGTFPNVGDPATLSGVSGRLLRLKNWVNDAYDEIQREQSRWLWMLADAEGSLVADVQAYDGPALGVSTRWGRWEPFSDDMEAQVSLWDPDVGRDDEGYLIWTEYNTFRRLYMSGGNVAKRDKPSVVSLSPAGELVFFPTPDKAYRVRCQYKKSPQVLDEDADVPEMPEEFHAAIRWKGLVYLGMYDEATQQLSSWQSKYVRTMEHCRQTQLPKFSVNGEIA